MKTGPVRVLGPATLSLLSIGCGSDTDSYEEGGEATSS